MVSFHKSICQCSVTRAYIPLTPPTPPLLLFDDQCKARSIQFFKVINISPIKNEVVETRKETTVVYTCPVSSTYSSSYLPSIQCIHSILYTCAVSSTYSSIYLSRYSSIYLCSIQYIQQYILVHTSPVSSILGAIIVF